MEEMFLEIRNIAVEAATIIARPNWASILSVVISGIAIIISLYVAWKQSKIAKTQVEISEKQIDISKQQNKIALFKERYAIFCEIDKIFVFCSHVKDGQKYKKPVILSALEGIFGIELCNKSIPHQLVSILFQSELSKSIIGQSQFLFSGFCYEDISDFLNGWTNYLRHLILHNDSDVIDLSGEETKDFIEKCETFRSKYIDIFESQLNLK